MAFEKGKAQTVGLVTMSGSDPTAPSGSIVAQVSTGGGAFGTATNALTSVGNGYCTLALTTSETNADIVAVRVTSDATDTLIQTYYFEDAYTAARAAYLDAAISSRSSHSAADVDTELTAAHGAGSWAGAAGSGANEVTVTVTDGTTALPNISVTIRNQAGVTLVAGPLVTDADGKAVFNLDDGDYRAVPSTTSLYSSGATDFTAPADVACEMTAATIPASTDPALCTVYGYQRDAQGALLGAGEGSITVAGVPDKMPVVSDDSIIGYSANDVALTNSAGLVSLELIRGLEYTLEIDNGLTTRTISLTVPDQASYNLTEELD
jgi:hypothetical protein